MEIIINPGRSSWSNIIKRPAIDTTELNEKVQTILEAVKTNGDYAIKKYTIEFDNIILNSIAVADNEISEAATLLSAELKDAINTAIANITAFHKHQLATPEIIETMPGIQCWRKNTGIEKVGLYIPGGSAPLFSTILMLCIPARLAGCKEIILCKFWCL